MTKAEYQRAYKEAKKSVPRMSRKAMTGLKQAYEDGAKSVAAALRDAVEFDRPEYAQLALKSLSNQLSAAGAAVAAALEKEVPIGVSGVGNVIGKIDEKYLVDAFKGTDISIVSGALPKAVNTRLMENLNTRLYSDGYTFSQRAWRVGDGFQDDIKSVMSAGFAQGRDILKIAKDLEVYVADGKVKLMKRYGRLEKGTSAYARRIPQSVDYRALRLLRTELYGSLKDAGEHAGYLNAGAMGLEIDGEQGPWYDWIMTAGRGHWDCDCPSLADGSPYSAGNVPDQPHPNCMCIVEARLMNVDDLMRDLKQWIAGEDIQYLNVWKSRATAAGLVA